MNILKTMQGFWINDKKEFCRRLLIVFLSIEVISLSFSIAVSSIAFAFSVILWVTILIMEKKWEKTPVDYFFVLFVIAEIISTIFSINGEQSLVNMKRLFIFTVFYMSFYAFRNKAEIRKFIIVFIVFTAFLSIIEIAEKFIFQFGRLGIFQHYMTTSGIKMIVCLYALPTLFNKNLSAKEKRILIILFSIILLSLILTMTRSSWLGFLVGGIVLGVVYNKKILLYLAAFLVLFAIFAPPSFKERALSSFDPFHPSNRTRVHMVETGLQIFKDYPVVGIGDVDIKKIYLQYTVPLDRDEGGHLHNNLIQILVCFGSFGFIIFALLFISLFIFLIKNFILVKKDEDLKILLLYFLLSYIIYF